MVESKETKEADVMVPFPDPTSFPRMTIYFGKDKDDLLERFKKLAASLGGNVSVAGLITACMEVCIDTLEKEAPDKRRFKMNNKVVVV